MKEATCAEARRCNEVLGVDFKGWILTGDGERCDPLTVSDLYSRYLLRAEGLPQATTQRAFRALFKSQGLPDIIRVDNGAPFASMGPGGLSKLSVWWIGLGIKVEFSRASQKGIVRRWNTSNAIAQLIGNRFPALRGVGPEFEAGSGDFHARTLPDGALRVKRPAFRDAGRAPNHKMAGSAGWLAGNTSLRGAHCRGRDCQFPAKRAPPQPAVAGQSHEPMAASVRSLRRPWQKAKGNRQRLYRRRHARQPTQARPTTAPITHVDGSGTATGLARRKPMRRSSSDG